MRIILDCNIWISFLLRHQTDLMYAILTDKSINVIVCKELLEEIKDVAVREKIRKYTHPSEVAFLLDLIDGFAVYAEIQRAAKSPVRDTKDLYLLSLAETVEADYLVSGDKDLLVLRNHGGTMMISLADFKLLRGL